MRANYISPEQAKTEQVFDGLYDESKGGTALLDSTGEGGLSQSYINSQAGSLPPKLQKAISAAGEENAAMIVDSVVKGMKLYQKAHGHLPTADLIEATLDQVAAICTDPSNLLDGVGSTAHHDPISAQPERVQIGILTALATGIPFANYLAAEIGSNEARLGIVSHQSASNMGEYTDGASLDGVNIGGTFLCAERRVALTLSGDLTTATGLIALQKGGSTGGSLLRGRSKVFVNGYQVAEENPKVSASINASPLSGAVILLGTTYTISGTVNLTTGAVALGFSPALPAGTEVIAEGYIDFEAAPNLAPEIRTNVQTWSLYAVPYRGVLRQTIDSKTQYNNELGIDLQSESLFAARNQVAVERHRAVLRKAISLAKNNVDTFDFDYAEMMQQKTRAQIWQDFSAVLGMVDQKMAELTMDRGITHLYVGKMIKAQWEALPRDIFEPSGLTAIPGIYRVGRLFGRFEVYYTPWEITETATDAQILCIGRSNSPARNSFVLADAVPVTVLPLALNSDMRYGQALYGRLLTDVNPHQPSASGAALITVTSLFSGS